MISQMEGTKQLLRNAVAPPRRITPQPCYLESPTGSSTKDQIGAERHHVQNNPEACLPAAIVSRIALNNMRASHFYLQGAAKATPAERMLIEASLLPAKATLNGIAVAAAAPAVGAHRKVGTLQFSMSKMH